MISIARTVRKAPFLAGVFLISLAVLMFQIVETRILSVIAWYYLAFFGISMAMLGMTAGAVYAYLRRDRFGTDGLVAALTDYSLACAVSIPISLVVQLTLITSLTLSVTTIVAWSLLTTAMAVPYVFAGVVVSLALTKSPFPVSHVYGADLLGASLGCVSVLLLLNVLDAPSAILVAGVLAGAAGWCFSASGNQSDDLSRPWWRKPTIWVPVLSVLLILNAGTPYGIRPILVKNQVETSDRWAYEKWNSYSRVTAKRPVTAAPFMWASTTRLPKDIEVSQVYMTIDGAAGTMMQHYDGTPKSIEFLRYDLVNLAYNLPDLDKSAVIGVGGGRDVLSAHLYGVEQIVGIELNPIFIGLHAHHPFYKKFSGLSRLPNLSLHVADARSWFASTQEKFDLVQMSMIDTWAATGAGAFSLSENGLYTLEGWRAFFKTLNDDGIFTVSRWYGPENIDETGRMISLATGTVLDAGIKDARPHIFVANADRIATLVLSKRPFTAEDLRILHAEVDRLGFHVLIAPDRPSVSPLLNAIVASTSVREINRVVADTYLDLSVPTDNRPFFFNQLKMGRIGQALDSIRQPGEGGVIVGNLLATAALLLILMLSTISVCLTVLVPLRSAARDSAKPLIVAGTGYIFPDRAWVHARGNRYAPVLQRLLGASDLFPRRVPVQPDSRDGPGQPAVVSRPNRDADRHAAVGLLDRGLPAPSTSSGGSTIRGDHRSYVDGPNRPVDSDNRAAGPAPWVCVPERDAPGCRRGPDAGPVVLGHQRRDRRSRIRTSRHAEHELRHQRHRRCRWPLLPDLDTGRRAADSLGVRRALRAS